jgi:phage gp36-like protein
MKVLPEKPRKPGVVPIIPDVQKASNEDDFEINQVENENVNPKATIQEYLLSIFYMPYSMRMVCLTNLCCWMAHVCYSLYFTDFVGEAVYGGDPTVQIFLCF